LSDNVKWIFDVGFSHYELLEPRSLRYAAFAPIILEYELYAPQGEGERDPYRN
jgi:hypothetical protein